MNEDTVFGLGMVIIIALSILASLGIIGVIIWAVIKVVSHFF